MESPTNRSVESRENIKVVETVRVALYHKGSFLILEKSPDSKNPGAKEFPGGKIDAIVGAESTAEEQIEAVRNEVKEETGLDITSLSPRKIDEYANYFETKDTNGNAVPNRRIIHQYLVELPDDFPLEPLAIDQTLDASGSSEDKHEGFQWLSPDDLRRQILTIKENPHTQSSERGIARNSRRIKALLRAIDNSASE